MSLSALTDFIKIIKGNQESDKMQNFGTPLSIFCNNFNKFNNTEA